MSGTVTEWIVFLGDDPARPELMVECEGSLDYAEKVKAAMPGSRIAWRRIITAGWSIEKPKKDDDGH